MIIKNIIRVETLDFFDESQVIMIETSNIFVYFGNSSENNFTNFPRERYELFFPFFIESMEPKFIFPNYPMIKNL
jgi:hypothetical protein